MHPMTFMKIAALAAAAMTLTACTTATRANFSDFTHGTGQYANRSDASHQCYKDYGPGGYAANKVPTVRCPYRAPDFVGGN